MLEDIYKAPAHDLSRSEHDPSGSEHAPFGSERVEKQGLFFVVSVRKLFVFYFFTFGFYHLVWFYSHWSVHKKKYRSNIWPAARALFSIFSVHSLFRTILSSMDAERVHFKAGNQASLYVVLSILSNVVTRFGPNDAENITTHELASVLFALATVFPLRAAQQVANRAALDPEGASNDQFTMGNYLWCILGAVLWLAILGSYFFPEALA